ncbi:glycosyltransferase involved in cell wall biosynthesis [Nesterenkonia lutea]|uniref:Glycosyltransferase involved in cell wall biosynthesis n=1 Tax=Nesterenkonia lutea TaxID=272919 RepID=A0ABR9JFQ9_9MICC|nr:glycosyltransferase involved in cell wall biosynthesis [Nesterenkonia lutea]
MRICIIASSQFPIREPFAGGLEAFTHTVARRLITRGHSVTLFAAGGSDPDLGAQMLIPERLEFTEAARSDVGAMPVDWMQQHHAYLGLMLHLAGSDEFDVIHNNSLHHLPLALSSMVPAPVLTTLHTPPTPWLESAMNYASPSSVFMAVSSATAQAWQETVSAGVIANGVDTEVWKVGPGGPGCVWTGRLVAEKAPHLAIDAARAAGRSITLAGPIMDRAYFDAQVAPRLGDDAVYAGHLHHAELVELVGSAEVAVVSSQWDEPYGLVAAEAMSCGTPVAAFARGGLVEIVTEETGALAADGSVASLAAAITRAATCERRVVRERAEQHLSLDRMVTEYENVYAQMAEEISPRQAAPVR